MEKDETIVTDISVEENASIEKEVTPARRGSAMQDIVEDSFAAQQELERQLLGGDESVVVKKPIEPNEVEVGPVEDEFVTVKINGKTSEVEASKVEKAGGVEAYQRTAAASMKQNEVALREAELKKREEELVKLEADVFKKHQEQKKEVDVSFGKDFADQVFENPDEVANKVNQLRADIARAEELAAQALSRAEKQEAKELERAEKERQSVIDHFHTNYGDIASDPGLTLTLNSVTGTIAEENPTFTQQQIVDKAAEHVYEKYNLHTDEPEKNLSKKPPKSPPRASARKVLVKEPKVKTPHDTVLEMSKGRAPMRN